MTLDLFFENSKEVLFDFPTWAISTHFRFSFHMSVTEIRPDSHPKTSWKS